MGFNSAFKGLREKQNRYFVPFYFHWWIQDVIPAGTLMKNIARLLPWSPCHFNHDLHKTRSQMKMDLTKILYLNKKKGEVHDVRGGSVSHLSIYGLFNDTISISVQV